MAKKRKRKRNQDGYRYDDEIIEVVETVGPCSNFKRCMQYGVLGNGWCQKCWDSKSSTNSTARNLLPRE